MIVTTFTFLSHPSSHTWIWEKLSFFQPSILLLLSSSRTSSTLCLKVEMGPGRPKKATTEAKVEKNTKAAKEAAAPAKRGRGTYTHAYTFMCMHAHTSTCMRTHTNMHIYKFISREVN